MGKKTLFSFILSGVLASATAAWAGTCTVDTTQTDQIIRGFGAASAWNAESNLSPYASTLWAVDNVNGHAGLSMLRTRIDPTDSGSGSAWNNEAANMTLAKNTNPNILIWSTEWSPPATYKNNNSVDGGGSNGALTSTATFKGAASGSPNSADTGYASYLVRYIQYIQSHTGVSLYAVSPQNEPDWDPTYEAAIWNGGQFDVFTGAFHSALSSAGLSTKIMITESFGDRLALASTTMDDATNAPFVGIIAGHIYGGGPNSLSSGGFSHLTNQDNWETEISDVSGAGPDNSMTSGLVEAGWVYKSIVNASMDAFHHWWIWGSDNSALITSSGVSKKLMVLGQYSKFVRPGFYRMGATASPSSGVSVAAFKSDSSSSPATVVIVATNGNSGTTSQTFSFSGVNVTSVIPWVTDNSNNLVQMAAVPVSGNSFTYSLTGPSVTSFVATTSGTTSATNTPTPVPPTNTPTHTLSPVATSTATRTNTPSAPTNTPTLTHTPLPPTATTTFTSTFTSVPPTATFTPVVSSTWRVNAGGPSYTDSLGNVWSADENFSGGSTVAEGTTIAGTSDPTLYDTQRYGTSFSYSFNVPAGSYQVTLKLAETYSGDFATGDRVFNISINGTTVASNLDIFAQVGSNTADDKVFNNVSPAGGVITIQFTGGTSKDTSAVVEALQVIPQPATPTFTASPTHTAVPPTATFTFTAVPPTATFTVVPPTATNTSVPPTATVTSVPPTATFTSMPPTWTMTSTNTLTATDTAVPPTSTSTSAPPTSTLTPMLPTATATSVPPTATFTSTTAPPTATFTLTPVPPTPTDSMTATPSLTATPSASPTHTAVPPTATFTAVPLTATFTGTPVPPAATDTPTAVVSSNNFKVQLLSAVTSGNTNSPHPQIQIVNTGSGPLNLNNVTVRYWFNCDCTTQSLQAWVDWAGLIPQGTNETGNVHVAVLPTSLGGQTDYVQYSFTGNIILPPGGVIQIQSRYNKSDWSNMNQSNDWSFAPYTSFTNALNVTGYLDGNLVWGEQPVGRNAAALTASSALAFPNPSTGNGTTLSFTLGGNASGTSASVLDNNNSLITDSNAKITLGIYTLSMRFIWGETLSGGAYGTTGQHDLYWNERDLKGAGLANGVYLLKVTVESNGQTSSTFAKILILQ